MQYQYHPRDQTTCACLQLSLALAPSSQFLAKPVPPLLHTFPTEWQLYNMISRCYFASQQNKLPQTTLNPKPWNSSYPMTYVVQKCKKKCKRLHKRQIMLSTYSKPQIFVDLKLFWRGSYTLLTTAQSQTYRFLCGWLTSSCIINALAKHT